MTTAVPILQAFKALGVSKPKGYELVNSGELRTYKIGTRRYTTRPVIREFIESRFKAEDQRNGRSGAEAA
jgi:excisionase family DNA binding protein